MWVYLLAMSAVAAGCTEEVEPVNIRTDQDFVSYATHTNIFKAQASRLATQVAGSNDIKLLGQEIFDYYTAANDELGMISREGGFTVPLSLDEKQQQLYNDLDRLWGQDFDNRYIAEMQKLYQENIKWFEEATNKLRNNELKNWASKSLQNLRVQQADFQQTAGSLGL